MQTFLSNTIRFISIHGVACTYKKSTQTYNVETGMTTDVDQSYDITVYPKQIKASQYIYPNLIGKEVVMFYLAANNLAFKPKNGEAIYYNGYAYNIDSYQEHSANGAIVLYRLVGVKG